MSEVKSIFDEFENPNAKKLEKHGFQIFIGDQSNPNFWKNFFKNYKKISLQ
mgnify:CR=1 FL=1